jgi:hypothetical protein
MPPDVRSVFALFDANSALCLECLTRKTLRRIEEIEPELEALGATLSEGGCAGCEGSGPVFNLGSRAA